MLNTEHVIIGISVLMVIIIYLIKDQHYYCPVEFKILHVVFVFIGIMLYIIFYITPKPEPYFGAIQHNTWSEFDAIPSLADAVNVDTPFTIKYKHLYKTRLSYNEIRKYYDWELKKHGWHFVEEQTSGWWFSEKITKTITYKKDDDYYAYVIYVGEPDYTFSFSIKPIVYKPLF